MKVMKFEGTPEEFKAVAHLFDDSTNSDNSSSLDEVESKPATINAKEAIKAMLTRIPSSDGQIAVYKALANGKLELNEFHARAQRPPEKMRGVLGALGKRIDNTKEIHEAGLPGNTLAILKWERKNGKDYISLTHDALVALKELELI